MPQHKQFLSNLFVIPKIGDLRPVINKKTQNEFVQYHYFKKEGVENTLVQFEFDFLLLDSLEQLQQKKKKIQN